MNKEWIKYTCENKPKNNTIFLAITKNSKALYKYRYGLCYMKDDDWYLISTYFDKKESDENIRKVDDLELNYWLPIPTEKDEDWISYDIKPNKFEPCYTQHFIVLADTPTKKNSILYCNWSCFVKTGDSFSCFRKSEYGALKDCYVSSPLPSNCIKGWMPFPVAPNECGLFWDNFDISKFKSLI